MKVQEYVSGLEGIIAAETSLSFLDVNKEKIIIRGKDLIDLSREKSYIDVVHLLLEGTLPTPSEREILEQQLKENYDVPSEVLEVLNLLPKGTHPMDGLRTGISMLGGYD